MSDPWNDSMLVEAFDASIAKYQQMHGFLIVKHDSSSQVFEAIDKKEDEGRVHFQPEERVHDLGTEPHHHL